MGTPNDLPFEAIYFEDEDLVRSSERSRPRPETNELALHVAELATQIAELTEAIHVLASRAAVVPAPVAPPPAAPEREPSLGFERPMPERVMPERAMPERPLSERFAAPRPRALEPMIAEPPARPRFDDEGDWPSEAEVTQFSRRQVDRDDGAW